MNKKLLVVAVSLTLGGCATGSHIPSTLDDSVFKVHKLTFSNVREFNAVEQTSIHNPLLKGQIASYEYKVGVGDVLNIIVYDHPELTTPAGSYRSASESGNVVHADGHIFYPYIGKVFVHDKSVSQIREVLSRKLAKYIEKPQVDVSVAAYRSQKVYVSGEVNTPKQLPITNVPMTLLDAIDSVGGVKDSADWDSVTITRESETVTVSVGDLVKNGNTINNVILKSGDIVHVPMNDNQKVFVLGEVNKPSVIKIDRSGISITEAIAQVGGINELSSDATGVFVIRKNAEVFQLDISNASNLLIGSQFNLEPQDIIYVTAAPITRWNRVIKNILPSITGFNELSEGTHRIKNW